MLEWHRTLQHLAGVMSSVDLTMSIAVRKADGGKVLEWDRTLEQLV